MKNGWWVTKVACLCGSTRYRDEFTRTNRLLTLEGWVVLAPGVFAGDGDFIDEDQKRKLDQLHLDKIDMAKMVYVIDVAGYIGESTRREIAYAESKGKQVMYLSQVLNLEEE